LRSAAMAKCCRKATGKVRAANRRKHGFSLTELVVAMAVALVLMGISMPYFLRAYRNYQLTNAAKQVADILRLTRYEAIRRNRPVNCVIQVSGSDPTQTNAWSDGDNDGVEDPTEAQIRLGSGGNLVDSGSVAGKGNLLSAANLGGLGSFNPAPTGSTIQFDQRGAVISTTKVTFFYLGSSLAPDAGYRAVILMPNGALQIWTGDVKGSWGQLR